MKGQIAAVGADVSGETWPKVLVYSRGTGPIEVVGGRSLITEIVSAAGGRNVFADAPQFPSISLEKVAARPADAFLIFNDYFVLDSKRASDAARFLFTTFPNMPASKDRRFAVTSYTYTSPGWRIAQTIEDVARQLHPGVFDTPSQTHQRTDVSGGS